MKNFLIGKNSVLDALKNDFPVKKIFIEKQVFLKNKFFLSNFKLLKKKLEIVDKSFLDKISKENHQGLIAEINEIEVYDLSIILRENPKNVLILDHIQDSRNFGAIIRTANAFGIKFIIFPDKRCSPLNATVLKTSSGGFVGINFIKVKSLVATIEKLKQNNYWIYGTFLNEKASNIEHLQFSSAEKKVLVIGSEKQGISKSILKKVDSFIKIQTYGTVQSLNVSAATAILCYVLFKKH